ESGDGCVVGAGERLPRAHGVVVGAVLRELAGDVEARLVLAGGNAELAGDVGAAGDRVRDRETGRRAIILRGDLQVAAGVRRLDPQEIRREQPVEIGDNGVDGVAA